MKIDMFNFNKINNKMAQSASLKLFKLSIPIGITVANNKPTTAALMAKTINWIL